METYQRMGKKAADQPTSKQKVRPLLLQMKTANSKQKLMAIKKAKEINCADVVINGNAIGPAKTKIYFDERLTREMSDLFYEARQLRKKGACNRAYFKNGLLLIQKTDKSPPTKITGRNHLQELEFGPQQRAGKRGRRESTRIEEDPSALTVESDGDTDSDEEVSEASETSASSAVNEKVKTKRRKKKTKHN